MPIKSVSGSKRNTTARVLATKTPAQMKAEARVAIAKDVIAQLKSGYLHARTNNYIRLTKKSGVTRLFNESDSGSELRGILNKRVKRCAVCAKGAMFVAAVKRFDQFKVEEYMVTYGHAASVLGDNSTVCAPLRKYFTESQLRCVENTFEGRDVFDSLELLTPAQQNFFDEYPVARARMTAIMLNIVRNGGTFVPKDL